MTAAQYPTTDAEVAAAAEVLLTASPLNGLVSVPSDRPILDVMVRAGLLWESDGDYFVDSYEWLSGPRDLESLAAILNTRGGAR